MAWVYILKCSDASYYTGSTVDLDKRVAEHQDGTCGGWTVHQNKGWSRARKEALMAGDFDLVRTLARRGSRAAKNI